MSTTNTPPPSEEVDLGQLFKMIGNAFNSLFQFIGFIFKQIFLAFVWLLFFIKSRILIFASAIILGVVLGFFVEKTSSPVYKSTIMIKQNYETGENLYGTIDYFNGLIKDEDFDVLGEVLGLDQQTSKHIKRFEIEPVLTENDKIAIFNDYIKGLDSLAASKVEYDEFIDNIKSYKHKLQQISISSTARANFKNVIKNILSNVNENEFFVNEQTKDLTQLQQQKTALIQSLAQSDSLQRTYKRVLEQQIDPSIASEIGITFEGNSDKTKTREFDLYQSDVELRREIVLIDRRIKDRANIIDVISSNQDSGFIDNTRLLAGFDIPIRYYYVIVLLLLSTTILLGLELFRFLERYKPEQN